MKSIKRGRGPSFMGGVAAAAVAVFGVLWTITAVGMGAPGLFAGFGLVFVGIAVMNAVYNFKNATGKNRYSEYDITDGNEEPDPLNERFGNQDGWADAPQNDHPGSAEGAAAREAFAFCPYCGAKLDKGDIYCGKCGRRIS